MKSVDSGFTPSSCYGCLHNTDEKLELIEGKPQCESSKGFCKYWNNLTPATREHEGFDGNPTHFLNAGGLNKFEVLTSKLAGLSGLDGQGLQTYDFYQSLAGTSDIEEEDFQSLMSIKLSYIRNRQIEEKIKAMRA